jgi:pimeloyl-ACP methyl ester carboxylesterase
LSKRLQKYHRDVEHAFWGWADVWLNPEFLKWNVETLLPHLSCPALLVQGYDDEYGTMRQIDGIAAAASHVDVLRLAHCGHSPHLDQPNALIAAVADFLGRTVGLARPGSAK